MRIQNRLKRNIIRAIVEVSCILFLYYSNLLMGEYTKSSLSAGRPLVWALNDIFTIHNFIIGLVSGMIGYSVFEFLRRKL